MHHKQNKEYIDKGTSHVHTTQQKKQNKEYIDKRGT